MFETLNVAIGMVVFFSLISMIASTILELISSKVRARGSNLRKVINSIGGGKEDFTKSIYEHPLIKSLTEGDRQTLPSYIQPESFARAMVEVVYGSTVEQIEDPRVVPPLDSKNKENSPEVLRLVEGFAHRADGQMEIFLQLVADHFNQINERALGWYRRRLSRWLFWVGLVLAIILNADATLILNKLQTDTVYRQTLVEYGQALTSDNNGHVILDGDIGEFNLYKKQLLDDIEDAQVMTSGWRHDRLVRSFIKLKDNEVELWEFVGLVGMKLLGFLITALGVSLGAPFWFDVLKKVMTIRGSLSPKDKKGFKPDSTTKVDSTGLSKYLPLAGSFHRLHDQVDCLTIQEAKLCAEVSCHVYDEGNNLSDWIASSSGLDGRFQLLGDGLIDISIKPDIDTQCCILKSDDMVIVAFRGTEGTKKIEDWRTNVDFKLVPFEYGTPPGGPANQYADALVHKGFIEALTVVWEEILQCLTESNLKIDTQVIFTGHSLGGALAVLAAARWRWEQEKNLNVTCYSGKLKGVYTIGQPKVGDDGFALFAGGLFGGHYIRAVNNRDIVPRVPPATIGFSHFGTLHYFDDTGHLRINASMLARLVDVALPEWAGTAKLKNLAELVKDHDQETYVYLYESWLALMEVEKNSGM